MRRNARYVIRSFIAWGVLKDTKIKGCYKPGKQVVISNPNITMLLYEAALNTDKEGKAVLELLKNNPAFFPFQLSAVTGNTIARQSNAIQVVRSGLDDELLALGNL